MKPVIMFLSLVLLVGPTSLVAQLPAQNSVFRSGEKLFGDGSAVTLSQPNRPGAVIHPFALHATIESVSSLGGQVQIATNLNHRMNMRSGFDVLLWKRWITYGGFTAPATVNLISNNTSLDFYPFANHGLRFSPGILIHNPGAATSLVQLAPFKDGSFILNGHTYYSKYTPPTNPDPSAPAPGPEPPQTMQGLQLRTAAFTLTTGWGNMIPRTKTGPWSFPIEAGVAFLGSPAVKTRWVQGQICDAQFQNCQDAATNPAFQRDLQEQFGAYKSHLDLLKTYPIFSFGVSYSCHHRTIGGD
jgi:hypothetical protein